MTNLCVTEEELMLIRYALQLYITRYTGTNADGLARAMSLFERSVFRSCTTGVPDAVALSPADQRLLD